MLTLLIPKSIWFTRKADGPPRDGPPRDQHSADLVNFDPADILASE